jgi:hypothetical protein
MMDNLCQFNVTSDGIHEITVLNASRKTIDVLFDYLLEVYEQAKPDETIRLLIDNPTGAELPVGYLAAKSRDLTATPRPYTRTAILTRSGTMINIILSLMAAMRFAQADTQAFKPEAREDAITWLLKK